MTCYDERLQELQRQVARKKHLDAALAQLYSQRDGLEQKVAQLESIKLKEQEDVDRLEGGSLSAFFYGVIGKKDEKLTREREEAYAAAVKYDTAVKELAAVKEDIRRKEEERQPLLGCEARYAKLLEEKAAAIKASGSAEGAEIFRLEEKLSGLKDQQRELREAIGAGEMAWNMVMEVLDSLDSAEGWSTFDMLGGGLIADLAKHEKLDEAQWKIEQLQIQLRRFRTELADVTIYADVQVNLDGFTRFADYFFDGLFVDWTVRDRIHRSQEQVWQTKVRIESVLDRLRGMVNSVEMEEIQTKEKMDGLILKTSLS